jgi:dolichol-phosphate mannosyltransferase
MTSSILLSVVIPVWNEHESIATVSRDIVHALAACPFPWEAIWVDDGSTDGTEQELCQLAPPQRYTRITPHSGKSAAYIAGFRAAKGKWIATFDGDGQNRPEDILILLAQAQERHLDAVVGVRNRRRDPLIKRISSWLGNRVRRTVLKDCYTDIGCGLRVGRREAFQAVPTFEGMHRFMPVFMERQGYVVGQYPVAHHERQRGTSKFGIGNRFPAGLLDLMGVWWLIRRHRTWGTSSEVRQNGRPVVIVVEESASSPVRSREAVQSSAEGTTS